MNRRPANARLLFVLLGLPIGACAAPQPGTAQPAVPQATVTPQHPAMPQPIVRAHQLIAAILPLGAVPYDGFGIPVVRPNGRQVATQTGQPPTWPTILAQPEAVVPRSTSVAVYDLSWSAGVAAHRHTINEPAILGRSCDQSGFLIESPRPDGSRWIGYVAWRKGEITWLVNDNRVNAFPSLGPQGQLAWSRRATDAEHFELVIRTAQGEIVIDANGGDWLMPTFSDNGAGLFSMRLKGGKLSATFMNLDESETSHEIRSQYTIMSGATKRDAYQSLAGHVASVGLPQDHPAQLVFFHPTSLRMALWRPSRSGSGATILLAQHSTVGTVTGDGLALVTDAHSLIVHSIADPSDRRRIVPRIQIPRAIASTRWPFVLAGPSDGLIDLTAMRLISADELDDR